MNPDFRSGSVTGTGSAINVSLGFKPNRVEVINVTDGTVVWLWTSAMPAGTAIKIDTAAATQASNGISVYNGDGSTPPGFTIGSAISTNGKSLAWTAMRNGAGA